MEMHSKSVVIIALTIWLTISCAQAIEDFNVTDDGYLEVLNDNGDRVFITRDLMKRLTEESETWHWRPWLRTKTEVVGNMIQEVERSTGDSVDSFPEGILMYKSLYALSTSRRQFGRRRPKHRQLWPDTELSDRKYKEGAFVLYVLFGIYAFTLLAIVCNDYFIPCVEIICEDLKIPQNVAAATFMSVATSCPEFFVNVISTFLTQSDMGIGTIMGSAIFNVLGVAAVGGLAAIAPISIERGPVTRDVIIYMINVGVLVVIVWDGLVEWYEALVLGILYICYFIIMFNSMRIFALFSKIFAGCCKGNSEYMVSNDTKAVEDGIDNKGFNSEAQISNVSNEKAAVEEKVEIEEKPKKSVWRFPKEKSIIYKIWWIYTWPLKFILGLTIPSPITCRRFYALSFVMCIVWIGVNSYFVSWSMTVLGHTFFIPESVMGMTFLAFGGCLPEACSIYIMSRRGEGGIGVSNALGANSLAILFALGLPWLIKTLTLLVEGSDSTVKINSAGIDFVVVSLLIAACLLWIVLFIGKFKLRKSIGAVFLVLYAFFITFAILVEMGIIFDREVAL